MSMDITLFHPSGYLGKPSNSPYGKDVANSGLFSAITRNIPFKNINVLHQTSAKPEALAPQFCSHRSSQANFSSGHPWDTSISQTSGLMLRGAANLSELAWLRRSQFGDHAYNLVGLIHTLGPPMIREQIVSCLSAPIQAWDALICTSPAVQTVVSSFFDDQESWLQERFGASQFIRPQLPLIPLGVDVEAIKTQASNQAWRKQLRAELGLEDDAVLALWVGRLSFYEKAFPQAMIQAVERANATSEHPIHLAFCGWFPDQSDQNYFQDAIAHLAGNTKVSILDGSKPQVLAAAWAAADLFLSLVDNIQETFGLTPIEAMAAGLPIVASDWDGYRSTIRHEVDGFLIPTLLSPAGAPGHLLGHLHNMELESYQTYAGAVAQHTAVHVDLAAQAICRLANSKELRHSMGDAGQKYAASLFDWPVISKQYKQLFEDLEQQRKAAIQLDPAKTTPARAGRGDPFADFEPFATSSLHGEMIIKRSGSTELQQSLQVKLNHLYPGMRGTNNEAQQIISVLDEAKPDGLKVSELLQCFDNKRHDSINTTIVWLMKQGLISW